jgi:signal transduction histidine kinase
LGSVLARNWEALVVVGALDALAIAVWARRRNAPAAKALIVGAVLLPLTALSWPAGTQIVDLVDGRGIWLYALGDAAALLCWAALLRFALVFPSPPPRLRGYALVGPYALVVLLYGAHLLLVWRRDPANPWTHIIAPLEISTLAARVVPFLVVAALIIQYRRAPVSARRPLRWVVSGVAVALGVYSLTVNGWLGVAGAFALGLALLPLTVGGTIIRFRLFDIEVFLTRSLLWAGLTIGALAIYVILAATVSHLVGHGTVLFLASGLIALTLVPLRDRLQRMISRIAWGHRDNPFGIITQLGRIDTTQPPQEVLLSLATTIRASLRLAYVGIDVIHSPAAEPELAAAAGIRGDGVQTVPLVHGDETVGALQLDVGQHREPFGAGDHRLFDALSRSAGAIVNATRLTLALQRARQQVVTSREEERRRIRRYLHDVLGPTVAAGVMQLEAVRVLMDADPEQASQLVGRALTGSRQAIDDVRRLGDELRPAGLDQLGLVASIEARVSLFQRPTTSSGKGFSVGVEANGEFRALPAAVEVAAYLIAVEAVNNAARHAQATTCTVRLIRKADLTITIDDDGQGLPRNFVSGVGLRSMRERAEELEGTFEIDHFAAGTRVTARIPVRAELQSTESSTHG